MHFAEGTLWRALLAWQAASWRAKEDRGVLLQQAFSAWHSSFKRRAQILAATRTIALRWANRCTAAAWSAWVEVAAMKAEARNKVNLPRTFCTVSFSHGYDCMCLAVYHAAKYVQSAIATLPTTIEEVTWRGRFSWL